MFLGALLIRRALDRPRKLRGLRQMTFTQRLGLKQALQLIDLLPSPLHRTGSCLEKGEIASVSWLFNEF